MGINIEESVSLLRQKRFSGSEKYAYVVGIIRICSIPFETMRRILHVC
jgi:hypothetical protein